MYNINIIRRVHVFLCCSNLNCFEKFLSFACWQTALLGIEGINAVQKKLCKMQAVNEHCFFSCCFCSLGFGAHRDISLSYAPIILCLVQPR